MKRDIRQLKTAPNRERPDPAAGVSDGNSEAGFWVNVEEERQQFLVIITRIYSNCHENDEVWKFRNALGFLVIYLL